MVCKYSERGERGREGIKKCGEKDAAAHFRPQGGLGGCLVVGGGRMGGVWRKKGKKGRYEGGRERGRGSTRS
ncbi:hypothetical protein A3B21_01075 [Candidatus Uhrbacteria bacterium RIFCSPLOWO2_01_FULL_47_24]|uniref:Uncharacterized protein n=1 Tax=Candidatus Uhrbacteria bacterium RIFCSPLOWO2_01_FULL_47_24 TaxID=1802401 RepID=A0A1F7UNX6_9BACT|nr:MAG: hypothetical protein A2753_02190 [Candidatus Uhrbacteria bacterium RIFCSPHIGHO2_01_FULL_47_11]OGL67544.1 MAG: hypothetical protein A3D58_02275 [Candidatus Uhrbacteria bacterium RIFCSPHIGHO2_02_FULL_46_47]OGL76658.1 MAG: hypothetical protein A3F52_03770 [Candidatus Uhrbacteria bacterium RIFCSPHIGHO2_12_FULL_47_11]OGL79982.1 MAG: hypothetical protein A3B21_01075 [Candidatus Uhrbacteria bacterium RIFCSPLOWO2_01_FULL_47_24]OGL84363.1 MAG: hypothetical protein A3J03_00550 [Candidatus Uhrbact